MERITATLLSLFPDAYLQHCSGLLSLRFYCYGIIVLYISEIPLLFSLLIQYGLDYQAAVAKGKIQRARGVRSWVNSWYNENNCLTRFRPALRVHTAADANVRMCGHGACVPKKRVRNVGSRFNFLTERGGGKKRKSSLRCSLLLPLPRVALLENGKAS